MKQLFLTCGFALATLAGHAQFTRTYTGSLSATDPTIPGDRPSRDGVAGTCASNKTFAGTVAGAGASYDTYIIGNTSAASTCVTVVLAPTCTETLLTFASVYSGGFTASNLATNYKSDIGTSPTNNTTGTFAFTLAAKETVTIVVTGVGAGTCSAYSVTVSAATTLPVQVAKGNNANALAVYPNPVADVLHIEAAKGSYTLFNTTGQAVRQLKGSDVSMADLPSGVYMLQHDETKATTKVVKL